jgi:c-di-AMP phosphodiesterase-like protein
MTIEGVDASFVIYPYGGGVNVNARSLGSVNVQILMEKLGGGGHQTMAAAQFPDETVENIKTRVVGVIDEFRGDQATPVE